MSGEPLRVLGIDPGWAHTGYAVVTKDARGVRVDAGAVVKPQLKPALQRAMKRRSKGELMSRTYANVVGDWVGRLSSWRDMLLQPHLIGIERYLPYGMARTASHLASEYQGLLFAVCAGFEIPVQWTTPAQGQKLVLGPEKAKMLRGKDCKAAMVEAVREVPGAAALFATIAKGQHEHLADAVAAALVVIETERPDWETTT